MTNVEITKRNGWAAVIGTMAILLLSAGTAVAQSTIVWLDATYPSDINADGSVVVGNTADGLYETFRWTAESGVVRLGMHTAGLGGGGTPDVSADGNHVSATIITADSLYTTAGLWTKGIGWRRAIPPMPEDGKASGTGLASCWGMSGDGTTITGFYWRDNSDGNGSARTFTWDGTDSTFTAYPALPTSHGNCRGNDTSYDGSVVVGWSETAFGTWQPTLWENGTVTLLHEGDWMTEAQGISDDGNTVWGFAHNTVSDHREATIWLRNGASWDQHFLGVLPGTIIGYGLAQCNDMTANGETVVGYNAFDWYQGTGFVWTLEQGMMSAADFFAAEGFTLPANYLISTITGISDDGYVLTGFGYDTTIFPQQYVGFVATRAYVASVPVAQGGGGLVIESNTPNPFNPSTTINLSLERDQQVRLEIFDVRGRSVRTLHDGTLGTGRHELRWDGRDAGGRLAASGVYFARARSETGAAQSHHMTLVK